MGSITRSHSFVSGEKPTESEWNVDIDQLFTLVAGQLDTNNVDTTSSDGISVLNANQTVSGTRSHSGAVTITNDVDLIFGTDSDIKIRYDETTDDALRIDTGVENAPLAIVLKADQGDDAGDAWKVNLAAAAGVLTFGNDIASKGSYVTQLTLTPHATVASSTTAIAGHATVGGNLTVTGGVTVAGASAFDIGDSDKLLLGDSDDLTVYHDGSNSYITNATGALKIATETSGIAVTIGHTTSETTIADNATVTGTLAAGASTLASLVCTAAATFGGGTGSSGATITTGGAGTFDGILKTEDTTDATSTTDGSLQTDGGLSVAKDAILGNDVKLLTDSSVLSLGVGSDATLTHDGTTGVTIAANPVIVDSGDALTLDAHTGIFVFKDAGSEVLRFTEGNSGDVTVKLATNGKDLVFTDNGDATNMKILDAAAGINVPGEVQTTKIAYTDGDDAITIADGGGVTTSSTLTIGTVAAAGSDTDKFLVLDGSGNVDYRTGAQVLSDIGAAGSGSSTAADDISAGDGAVSIETTSGNITIDAQANDADVIIKVDDNGSAVTALTLDGSDEGNAIFVNDVQLKSDGALLEFGADLDTTLTHTDGTGLTLNSTNKLTFGDAASFIQQSADGTLRIDGEAIIDLNASTRVDVSGDLKVGGEVQTASIGYTDGDNAITIADGGGVTFAQDTHVANGSGLVIGNTAQVATNTLTGEAQIQGTANNDTLFSISRYSADGTPPRIHFAKSRNATIGNVTGAVQSGDDLGSIGFCGSDGTDFNNQSASIGAVVSGSVSGDTVPVDLIFNTGTAATERMRINASGNVGIGTAAPDGPLHVMSASAGSVTADSNADELVIEGSGNTGITILSGSSNAGAIVFGDAANNNLGQFGYHQGNEEMFWGRDDAQQMVLDSSGDVGIGTTDPDAAAPTGSSSPKILKIDGGSATDAAVQIVGHDNDHGLDLWTDASTGDAYIDARGDHANYDMRFRTRTTGTPVDAMTINGSGDIGVGTTDMTNGGRFKVLNSDGEYTAGFFNTHDSTPYGLLLNWTGAAPDNNTQHYLHCADNAANRLFIYADGDVANHDGTYGTISDVKFKQDIADVRSYWSDFKSLQYRKFRHKTDVEVDADAPYRLGLVAQEVETVFPALVPESPDSVIETQEAVVDEDGVAVLDEEGNPTYETISTPSGTTHKWVKSSIIEGPIMGSVVQELQTRLEAAEAKITALESA